MGDVVCFWIEPTGRDARWLRRYASFRIAPEERACAVALHGYHQALVRVEDGVVKKTAEGYDAAPDADAYANDPRWPTACSCGRVFTEDDERQVFTSHLYRRADTGEEFPLREAPVGAMWDAWWMHRLKGFGGPDGRVLVVQTPAGEWIIDGPSSDGSKWERTGEPQLVTARPSIGIGKPMVYHAFLTDGVLRDV